MSSSLPDRARLFLSRWLFSPLQGATLGTWRRALAENRWRVSPACWPRAALTTLVAARNSVIARRERRRFEEEWSRIEVREPLFVLGHYRNGTTHLHNLLAADPRLAAPTYYQVSFPGIFLLTESSGKRGAKPFVIRQRPHDNVALDLDQPAEDELALCVETLLSPHMDWHFPRAAGAYGERFLDFRDATPDERARWVEALRTFAQKLTLRHGKRLVFKSPLHTARIPLILEAFPDARFVHVHRHPCDVYRSTRKMELDVAPLFRYQRRAPDDLERRILERYRRLYERYFEDRELVPAGRLAEIGYARLVRDPLGTLAAVYRALSLPGFAGARDAVSAYLGSIEGYRTNVYRPLDPAERQRVEREWRFCFEAWGYETRQEEGPDDAVGSSVPASTRPERGARQHPLTPR